MIHAEKAVDDTGALGGKSKKGGSNDKDKDSGTDEFIKNDSDSEVSCYEDATSLLNVDNELEDGEIDNDSPPSHHQVPANDASSNGTFMTERRLRKEPAPAPSTKATDNDANSDDGDRHLSAQSATAKSNDLSPAQSPAPVPLRYMTMDPPKVPESLRYTGIHSIRPRPRPQRLLDMRPRPPPFLRYATMRPPPIPSSFRRSPALRQLEGRFRYQASPRRHNHQQQQRGTRSPSPYQQDYHQWVMTSALQSCPQPSSINFASTTRSYQHHSPSQRPAGRRN